MVVVRPAATTTLFAVPEISRFHGITIRMFHRDHLPPHLHAQLGDDEITIEIETLVTHGRFPLPALRRTLNWIELHRAELFECWTRARDCKLIPRVPPLE
jgi:hypothetical protein